MGAGWTWRPEAPFLFHWNGSEEAMTTEMTTAMQLHCLLRYDVVPTLADAKKLVHKAPPSTKPQLRESWIRNRLDERGYFVVSRPSDESSHAGLFVTLHCFFISLEETDIMLTRLRGEKHKTIPTVARSKITKAIAVITPIDNTAKLVSHWPTK